MSGDRLADVGIHLRRPNQSGNHRPPCPQCLKGKHDDALSVTIESDGGAVWFCHRCEWTGGFGPERLTGTTWRAPKLREVPPEPEQHQTLSAWGLNLWEQCSSILPGTPAATYLDHRCCIVPPGDLRWHAELPYYIRDQREPVYVGPALVALVTDVLTGEPISLHRTWLEADGRDKAQLGRHKPRKTLFNHRSDGVIRLWPDDEVTIGLAIGEGIETCLAAAAESTLPVWATMNARNLAEFPVLPGLEGLIVLVDHDWPNAQTGKRAGDEAAKAVVQRYAEAGFDPRRDIRLIRPINEGEDVADVVAAKRRRAA
jgi:putative DNA primase/helicase